MNRQFKTQFHGGYTDLKPIVTMSVTVNNGKRFKELTDEERGYLVEGLLAFKKQLEGFTEDIEKSISKI